MKIVVVTPEEFSARAADLVAGTIQSEAPNICFPTGDTPQGLYKELVRRYHAGTISLSGIRAFGLDEWGTLQPGHPVRCSSRMQELLYQKTDIPADAIYYLEPTVEHIEAECAAYDALIAEKGNLTLSILGVGMNGHIGFNEPGSTQTDRTRVVALDDRTQSIGHKYGFESTPTWGVTVGLATLLESKEILIMANGEHKAEIIGQVVNGPMTPDIPASLLRNHPNCTLLLDTPAAKRL